MLGLQIYQRAKSCNRSVVFSCLRNCSGCTDDDFRDDGREFQHVSPETAKARKPNVTVRVHYEGKRCTPVVSLFKINISDKLSQGSPDRFLANFYYVEGILS